MRQVIEYSPVRGSPEQQGVPLRLSEDIRTTSFKTYACRECLKAIDKHPWRHSRVLGQQISHILDDHNATLMNGHDARCKFMSKWVLLLVCKCFNECAAMKVKNCWGDIRLTTITVESGLITRLLQPMQSKALQCQGHCCRGRQPLQNGNGRRLPVTKDLIQFEYL